MRMKKSLLKICCVCMAFLLLTPNVNVNAAQKKKSEEYASYQLIKVTDYGADKKGKNDSSAAVQLAIKEAAKAAPEGKKGNVVYFPKGTYKISKDVLVSKAVTIVAENNTTINCKSDIALKIRSDKVTVDGGKWVGNKDAEQFIFHTVNRKKLKLKNLTVSETGIALHANGGTTTLTNCKITKCVNRGIRLVSNAKVTLNECSVTYNGSGYLKEKDKGDIGHGITVNASKVIVNASKISNNYQCGISLVSAKAEVNNSTLKDNYRHGIGTYEKCTIKAKKTDFVHNGYNPKSNTRYMGVSLLGGSQAAFENCTFTQNNHSGVWIYGKNTKAEFNNCTFEKNSYTQLHVEGYAYKDGKVYVTLKNTTFKNSKYGILRTGRYSIKEKNVKFKNVKTKYWKG